MDHLRSDLLASVLSVELKRQDQGFVGSVRIAGDEERAAREDISGGGGEGGDSPAEASPEREAA